MIKINKRSTTISFIAGMLVTTLLFFLLSFSFSQNAPNRTDFPQQYRIITPPVPDELSFAGERIPQEDFEIRERVEREFIVNTYWHSSTLLLIKRANRWFPVIEPILRKNGIPVDFKYISVIESNLTNAISPAGAVGFWQFIKSAGLEYDLEINSEIDERYNVEKATEAACKYILKAKEKFGTWTLAAVSFNMGFTGVESQLDRQKETNYYDMTLNEETSRYIARAVSLKEIMTNPTNYGFEINESELYQPLRTKDVVIDSSILHFGDFAKQYGISYKTLKYYNPWLRDNALANKSKKSYTIKIPN